MSKARKKIDAKQAAFAFVPRFDAAGLKAACKAACKASGLSVDQIADKMSEFLGRRVHRDTVYAFQGKTKAHYPKTDELAALVYATGRGDALDALGAIAGLSVIDAGDRQLLEIARLEETRANIDGRLGELRSLRKVTQ